MFDEKIYIGEYFLGNTTIKKIKEVEEKLSVLYKCRSITFSNHLIKIYLEAHKEKKISELKNDGNIFEPFNLKEWFPDGFDRNQFSEIKDSLDSLTSYYMLKIENDFKYELIAKESLRDVRLAVESFNYSSGKKDYLGLYELIKTSYDNVQEEINKYRFVDEEKYHIARSKECCLNNYDRKFVEKMLEIAESKNIGFDTAGQKGEEHLIPKSKLKIGRLKRNTYESICSPKLDLFAINDSLNMGMVSCDKCIKSLINIVQNLNKKNRRHKIIDLFVDKKG